jgi:Type III restriction enzyme, res subunit
MRISMTGWRRSAKVLRRAQPTHERGGASHGGGIDRRIPRTNNRPLRKPMTTVRRRSSASHPSPYFGEYPPDFFDFIIIDECHRGGANDESNWRGILECFAPAMQLGRTIQHMTRCPHLSGPAASTAGPSIIGSYRPSGNPDAPLGRACGRH